MVIAPRLMVLETIVILFHYTPTKIGGPSGKSHPHFCLDRAAS